MIKKKKKTADGKMGNDYNRQRSKKIKKVKKILFLSLIYLGKGSEGGKESRTKQKGETTTESDRREWEKEERANQSPNRQTLSNLTYIPGTLGRGKLEKGKKDGGIEKESMGRTSQKRKPDTRAYLLLQFF